MQFLLNCWLAYSSLFDWFKGRLLPSFSACDRLHYLAIGECFQDLGDWRDWLMVIAWIEGTSRVLQKSHLLYSLYWMTYLHWTVSGGYRFQVIVNYLSKASYFNLPNLHVVPPLAVTTFKFHRDLWHPKTRVTKLSCGTVCIILYLAVLIQYRHVMDGRIDRQTDTMMTANTALAQHTHTHNHFTALLEYVRDQPGEQVPER